LKGFHLNLAYSGEKVFKAREVSLNLNPETKVILLPNIAGHIGGDITAGILATRMEELKGTTLFIDIGTNGEIVLSKNDKADIIITQKDIREVQLAKGAIYSWIMLLLSELNEEIKNIDRIILGGAFGSYLNKVSAVEIGILPDIDLDKIISAGNTAGTGASLVLLSEAERKKAIHLAQKTEHIELADCSNFQEEFLKAMTF